MPFPLVAVVATAAMPIVTGAAALAVSWWDRTFNGGGLMNGVIKPAIQGVLEPIGEAQQDAGKQVGLYGAGKLVDILGQVLTTIMGRQVGDAVRGWGQSLMGVDPAQQVFGPPNNPNQPRAALGPIPSPDAATGSTPAPRADADINIAPELAGPRVETASWRAPDTRSSTLNTAFNTVSPVTTGLQNDFTSAGLRIAIGPQFTPTSGVRQPALDNNIGALTLEA